ncbi:MAG: hypothetical protein R2856_29830 [Caldilineaceae bacterium]
MKTRKTLFIIIAVVALSLVAFVGSAFAQDATPPTNPQKQAGCRRCSSAWKNVLVLARGVR